MLADERAAFRQSFDIAFHHELRVGQIAAAARGIRRQRTEATFDIDGVVAARRAGIACQLIECLLAFGHISRKLAQQIGALMKCQLAQRGAADLMHELAFGITSTNLSSFAGPVKNPYDTTRIPGGSSGGTAVAIAAEIVTCGLGTDTGGSTRVPAALTGIVGLRPSVGNGGARRRYNDDHAVIPISHTRDTVGPMGKTVADVALLDSVITGTVMAAAEDLRGKRFGVPPSMWSGLDKGLQDVVDAARKKLIDAGAVVVNTDIVGLFDLNAKLSFPIALHEPIEDIPAYLKASGIEGITLADIAAKIASPDVKGAFGAITADAFGKAYPDAIGVLRPQLQKLYENYFRDNNLDAILFPTTIAPAPAIDTAKGSGEMTINGGKPVPTFDTMIRNTDPGSNAGIPGLSLFAGMISKP